MTTEVRDLYPALYPDSLVWEPYPWFLPEKGEWQFGADLSYHARPATDASLYPGPDFFRGEVAATRKGPFNLDFMAAIDREETQAALNLFWQWDLNGGPIHQSLRYFPFQAQFSGRQHSFEADVETINEATGGLIATGAAHRMEWESGTSLTSSLQYAMMGHYFDQNQVLHFDAGPVVFRNRATLNEKFEFGANPRVHLRGTAAVNGAAEMVEFWDVRDMGDVISYAYRDMEWNPEYKIGIGFSSYSLGGKIFGMVETGLGDGESFAMQRDPATPFTTKTHVTANNIDMHVGYTRPGSYLALFGLEKPNPFNPYHHLSLSTYLRPAKWIGENGLSPFYWMLSGNMYIRQGAETGKTLSTGIGTRW